MFGLSLRDNTHLFFWPRKWLNSSNNSYAYNSNIGIRINKSDHRAGGGWERRDLLSPRKMKQKEIFQEDPSVSLAVIANRIKNSISQYCFAPGRCCHSDKVKFGQTQRASPFWNFARTRTINNRRLSSHVAASRYKDIQYRLLKPAK